MSLHGVGGGSVGLELGSGISELAGWAKKALRRHPPAAPSGPAARPATSAPPRIPPRALSPPPPPPAAVVADGHFRRDDNIWQGDDDSSIAPAQVATPPPAPLRRVIRFRVIKLSKTGMYAEKVLSLDPVAHVLLFQDPPGNGLTEKQQVDRTKGFAMCDIKSMMPFEDGVGSPSAPMSVSGGGAAFTSRLLLLFQPELTHRSYELLFPDAVQRNVFLALVQELYGSGEAPIEILHCDDALPVVGTPSRAPAASVSGPRWIPDADVSECMSCRTTFTIIYRKHHCRSCGGIFCAQCSSSNASLPDLAYAKPVRVCDACFRIICDVRKQGLMIAGATNSAAHIASLATSNASSDDSFDRPSTASIKRGSVATDDATGRRRTIFHTGALSRRASMHLHSPLPAVDDPTRASSASVSAPPTRDIYGFLLSSPTLALAAAVPSAREQSVMYISAGTNDAIATPAMPVPTQGASGGAAMPAATPAVGSPSSPVSPSSAATALASSIHAQQQSRLAAQHLEFEASRERWNKYLVLHTTIDRNSTELKRLVRKGIPPELRGQIWQILSGSREKQQQLQQAHATRLQAQVAASIGAPPSKAPPSRDHIVEPNYYRHCLTCSQLPDNINVSTLEIEKDLHRTFPDNALYEAASEDNNGAAGTSGAGSSESGDTTGATDTTDGVSPGLSMLRRVLLAYSFHCPAIGYAQSMNFVTALLLLFMDEEEAFYLLIVILEDLCCVEVSTGTESRTVPGEFDRTRLLYHSPDLAGAHIDTQVFIDLMREKLPKVAAQFEKLSFPLAPLTMSWLLCLFVNTLPLETTLVLWDIIFSEGIKVVFRASLTLLKVHEKAILKSDDFEEMLHVLKTCPAFHPSIATPDPRTPTSAGGAAEPPQLLPPAIDTASFIRICFDPLWMGSFPMTRITALRSFHRLQVEADLAARRARTKAARAATGEREKARLARNAAANTMTDATGDAAHGSAHSTSATSSPAASDPSVQFALTSSGSSNNLSSSTASIDPRFASRLDLFNSVTHLVGGGGNGVIEGFFPTPTSSSVTAASPLSTDNSDVYVPILAPQQEGQSPRVGQPIRLEDADSGSPPEAISIPPLSPVASSIIASPASPRDPPARPPKAESGSVKLAIKRVSLIRTEGAAAGAGTNDSAGASAPPAATSSAASPSVVVTGSSPSSTRRPQARVSSTSSSSSSPAGRSSSRLAAPGSASTSASASPSKASPASPSMLSSMLSSVGRALTQVSVLLSEDEREVSARVRRESASAHHRTRSASATTLPNPLSSVDTSSRAHTSKPPAATDATRAKKTQRKASASSTAQPAANTSQEK